MILFLLSFRESLENFVCNIHAVQIGKKKPSLLLRVFIRKKKKPLSLNIRWQIISLTFYIFIGTEKLLLIKLMENENR